MVVRMLHSEKGGFLHSDDKDFTNDGTAEVYLWNFKGKSTSLEAMSSFSLFLVEVASPQIKFTCGLTEKAMDVDIKRQDENKRFGKVINYSQFDSSEQNDSLNNSSSDIHFRFRHLNTGRLVIDQEINF
jgi:hypothetical protein